MTRNTAQRTSTLMCLLVISSEGVKENHETRQSLDHTRHANSRAPMRRDFFYHDATALVGQGMLTVEDS